MGNLVVNSNKKAKILKGLRELANRKEEKQKQIWEQNNTSPFNQQIKELNLLDNAI